MCSRWHTAPSVRTRAPIHKVSFRIFFFQLFYILFLLLRTPIRWFILSVLVTAAVICRGKIRYNDRTVDEINKIVWMETGEIRKRLKWVSVCERVSVEATQTLTHTRTHTDGKWATNWKVDDQKWNWKSAKANRQSALNNKNNNNNNNRNDTVNVNRRSAKAFSRERTKTDKSLLNWKKLMTCTRR